MKKVIYVVIERTISYEYSHDKLLKAFDNKSEAEAYYEKMCVEAKDDNMYCYENGIDETIVYGIETVELV